MTNKADVQYGTQKELCNEVGNVADAISDSTINVTVYMSEQDKYKLEFKKWSKKTAQSTLEMCRVVYEAKIELASQDFLKFCNDIGRNGLDATIRKYLKIGEKYDLFFQYAELLPNAWTSIYEITQLPTDVFEALVATENSMANMSGDQIKLLMGKKTQDNKSKISPAPAVVAPTLPSQADAPTTAQKDTAASDNVEAAPSSSGISGVAAASSDELLTDSTASVTDSVAVANDASTDESSTESDHVFAKQATSTMLERVSAAASTTVEVESEEVFVPYEVTIRFNTKPSEAAIEALIDSVMTIKSKYRLEIEIKSQVDHVM